MYASCGLLGWGRVLGLVGGGVRFGFVAMCVLGFGFAGGLNGA